MCTAKELSMILFDILTLHDATTDFSFASEPVPKLSQKISVSIFISNKKEKTINSK